jgi:hypothetical protein
MHESVNPSAISTLEYSRYFKLSPPEDWDCIVLLPLKPSINDSDVALAFRNFSLSCSNKLSINEFTTLQFSTLERTKNGQWYYEAVIERPHSLYPRLRKDDIRCLWLTSSFKTEDPESFKVDGPWFKRIDADVDSDMLMKHLLQGL